MCQVCERLKPNRSESVIALRCTPELRKAFISFILSQTVKVLKSLKRILIEIRPREFLAWCIDLKDRIENIKKAGIPLRVYLVVDAITFKEIVKHTSIYYSNLMFLKGNVEIIMAIAARQVLISLFTFYLDKNYRDNKFCKPHCFSSLC